MKNSIIVLLVLLFTATGVLEAQLPNPNFENWNGDTLIGWSFINYDPNFENALQSTDAYSGDYAVRLKGVYNDFLAIVPRPGLSTGKIPLTTAYTSLRGNVKGTLAGNDHFVITVDFFDGATTLAVGSAEVSLSTTEWTSFEAPINYGYTGVPDSAWISILITSGLQATEGSDFLVDNLHFEGASAVDDLPEPERLTLYPNPATEQVNVSFYLQQPDDISFSILNLSGQTLKTIPKKPFTGGANNQVIPTETLAPGIYFLKALGVKTGFVREIVVKR
ncbi:MAG: T9SS type A sorting domain-containing protein [Bacteroidales bacterium]